MAQLILDGMATLQNCRRQISVNLRFLVLPVGLSAFLGFLYFNRIQNLLFNGAYVDLGTWAHLAYGPTSLSLDASTYYPSLLAYFKIHFRPIFFLLSSPSIVLPINIVDNISLIFAAEAMLIALSAATAVLALRLPFRPLLAGLLAAVMGLAFYFSAPNLSALGYPHFEPLFAVATVLFLLAYANGRLVWAALVLVILLSVREDMGLHFGLFILVFALYAIVVDQVPWRKLSFLLVAGVISLCYSAMARYIQLHFFPGGRILVGDYLGDPLYAHVTKDFLDSRLAAFWDERSYILLAFLMTIGLAAYYRRPAYLLGYVIYAPWLVFNLLAIKEEAGALSTYRMYPFALALIWPIVYEALWVNRFGQAPLFVEEENESETVKQWGIDARRRLSVVLATILICTMTALVAAPSMAPVRNVKLAKSSQRDATFLLMTFLEHGGHHRFGLKVSRSVAAVGSTEIKAGDVVPREIDPIQGAPVNGVLFHPTARDACHTLKLVTEIGFDRIIRLGKSNIFVAFHSNEGRGLFSALDEANAKKLRIQEAQFPYWVSDKVQRCFNKEVAPNLN